MLNYSRKPVSQINWDGGNVNSFLLSKEEDTNIDWVTVESFGEEWTKFSSFSQEEINHIGNEYFDIIPKKLLNNKSYVLDVGCGTGRWTKYICDKVGFVEAIDPSKAVLSACQLLNDKKNVRISLAEVSALPFEDGSFDLVFSLGVLHHVPSTIQAIKDCVKKVKPNGYFLVYLYYNLDNRGILYKAAFNFSSIFRKIICNLPAKIKKVVCDIIAYTVYFPLIFVATTIKKILRNDWYKKLPLSYYVGKSINVIKNDALDRFGTPLEQRFSRVEIEEMMKAAGLVDIVFSERTPFWHAIGKREA